MILLDLWTIIIVFIFHGLWIIIGVNKSFKFPAFLGKDVLLNEVIYIFFLILIKFVISGWDVTLTYLNLMKLLNQHHHHHLRTWIHIALDRLHRCHLHLLHHPIVRHHLGGLKGNLSWLMSLTPNLHRSHPDWMDSWNTLGEQIFTLRNYLGVLKNK